MVEFYYDHFADCEDFPVHLQYGFHNKPLYVHSHADFSELVIVLEGSSEHIVNNKSYRISKGDVFVISSDTEHGFIDPYKMKICNIMFKPDEVFAVTRDIKQLAGFQALFVLEPHYSQNHIFCSRLKLDGAAFQKAEKLISEIMVEYENKEAGWKDMVFSGFMGLCTSLSRSYRTDAQAHDSDIMKLADVVAYIENNYREQITLAQLAHISRYSERQLLRVFKSAFSSTPNAYIAELRIKKAKQLLETTPLSIGDIAWNCGFSDQNYFARFFRNVTSMTPSAYRSMTNREKN